jgi:hypothetical protein
LFLAPSLFTRPWLRIALLVYGALNAILYAGLLPLWEGFDEPFHYGYVQQLSRRHTLPVLGKAVLSQEVAQSFDLAPAGYAVVHNIGRGIAFGEYFQMTAEQRLDLRRRLEQIPPASAGGDSQNPNYEGHQPPLSYALLAPFDAVWDSVPLPARLLRLRLLCGLSAVLLLWSATLRLTQLLELPESVPVAVLFVAFSSQMFYGTVCHVANDWLAVPLFALLLSEAVAFHKQARLASGIRLGLVLSAGLLTKAYFLAMVPFAAVLICVSCRLRRLSWRNGALSLAVGLVIAAPWYARNMVLYKNLSGMQETTGGTPFGQLLQVAVHLPWIDALLATARTSLWTGNNSLWALSRNTFHLMFGLLTAALCLYLWRMSRGQVRGAERVLTAGVGCFIAALAYSAVLTDWSTHGAGISPAPWYVQALLAPGLCLLFTGLSPIGWPGRILALAITWTWAYVLAISYAVKLVPYYAGFASGSAHLSDLPHWYGQFFSGFYGALPTASLLPAAVLLYMTAAVVTMAVILAATVSAISCCPLRHFGRH